MAHINAIMQCNPIGELRFFLTILVAQEHLVHDSLVGDFVAALIGCHQAAHLTSGSAARSVTWRHGSRGHTAHQQHTAHRSHQQLQPRRHLQTKHQKRGAGGGTRLGQRVVAVLLRKASGVAVRNLGRQHARRAQLLIPRDNSHKICVSNH